MKQVPSTLSALIIAGLALTLGSCKPPTTGEQTQQALQTKPRILISTDIGGTDPDDNQSMTHLMMYSDLFDIEGIVSSPSYGTGSKEEILRMIDLYEKDYEKLSAHAPALMSPDELRKVCKQGRRGAAPLAGYDEPTEGSNWIIDCARRADERPLYILVWGALEDVAQALHDAPDIEPNLRVYWIGGPNKKWGVNSYAYVAAHHPNLWMIENNATYRGIFTENKKLERHEDFDANGMTHGPSDTLGMGYYDYAIRGAGALGDDFINYYKGVVKMGDTPSLLYMMNGDPEDPTTDSWGGRFVPFDHSSRYVFNRQLNTQDSIAAYGIIEIWMNGPEQPDMSMGTPCLTLTTDRQDWDGYYMGGGRYMARYCPKGPGTQTYVISSNIEGLSTTGAFTAITGWPGTPQPTDYTLGAHWYTDCPEPELYDGGRWQGVQTQLCWRDDILRDWATRWAWLREE